MKDFNSVCFTWEKHTERAHKMQTLLKVISVFMFMCIQVSDFLSGRSPLTLALRVGDHMMFVQLQLAAQQSGGPQLQHRHLISRGNTEAATGQPTVQPSRVPHIHPLSPHHHPQQPHNHSSPQPVPSSSSSSGSPSFPLPNTHHQPLPPMYHQSPSSPQCSPPTPPPHSPRPSHIPGGLFRSPSHQHHHHHHHHHHYHQPSSSQPSHDIGQVSPVAPVVCPEVRPQEMHVLPFYI